jgi:hypothetical protein
VVALRSDRLDPIRERMHEVVLEYSSAVADELAMFIGMAGIGLGLLHGGTFRNTSDCLGRLFVPKDPIALGEQLTIAPG